MLTETVAGRTYDYSHNVGRGAATGMGFNNPVAMAVDADDAAQRILKAAAAGKHSRLRPCRSSDAEHGCHAGVLSFAR
jgi:hypothetical protein